MRVGLLTAEASGDRLARGLLPVLEADAVFGLAEVPGCVNLMGRSRVNAVGLVEVVNQVPRALRLLHLLTEALVQAEPDVVVTIDSAAFHLPLARRLQARGIPVVHWVSPQVWAWRPHRIRQLARSVQALGCLFPFEAGLYRATSVDAVFTGHPTACASLSERPEALGIAAGSRAAERRQLGPLFAAVAAELGGPVVEAVPPGFQPVVPGALVVPDVPAMAARVRAALVCSGTATLELACAGVPMLSAYRLNPLSWSIARRLVQVPTAALPNLLLGRNVVPEVFQPTGIRELLAVERLLGSEGDTQRQALLQIPALLQGAHADLRMAALIRRHAGRRSMGYNGAGSCS